MTKPAQILIIRPPIASDYTAWQSLWNGSNGGITNEAVTAETWNRLLNPIYPVHGLLARLVDGQSEAVGLVHYILHPVTGHIEPVCYMQDLFVDPAHRQHGIARALIAELAALGAREHWARLYWLAEADNKEAQALYKSIGVRLDFSLHVMPLVRE